MADAEDLKSAKYFDLFTKKCLNKRGFDITTGLG
jgi:hypothetical protein